MPSLLLTPELVTKLSAECLPGMKKPRDVVDRGCVGLALRLRPRGATWSFKMVRHGEEKRIKLGTPAMLSLAQACQTASNIDPGSASKIDPLEACGVTPLISPAKRVGVAQPG